MDHTGLQFQGAAKAESTKADNPLSQTLCCGEHFVRSRPHANVLGEVDPTHHSRRVHQELCGPGNVMPVRSPTHVQQIVATDHLSVGVGKNAEGYNPLSCSDHARPRVGPR
jgi:hypothetical protein